MRIFLFLLPFVFGIIFDAITLILWLAGLIVNSILAVAFGLFVVLVKLLPFVPGTAILGGIVFAIYTFGAWVGIGLVPIVVLGVVDSGTLIKVMHAILRELYINPLKTFQGQHNGGEASYITFIASEEDFFSIRKAANMAGIWFSSVKWEPIGVNFVYKVWLREKSE